jgi:hypothetical protein
VTIALPTGETRQITDPSIQEFNVWSGPGVTVGGVPQSVGFIAQWSRALAAPDADLARYEVSFHASREGRAERPVYVVAYVHDPASAHGYVYIPGLGDPGWETNRTMRRPGEGRWFAATPEWDAFIARVLVSGTTAAPSSRPTGG